MKLKYKIIAATLLIFMLVAQINSFAAITGYTNKNTYVYKYPSTKSARKAIKINTKLTYVSSYKSFYRVKVSGKKVYILKRDVSKKKTIAATPKPTVKPTPTPSPTKAPTSWKDKVTKTKWSTGTKYLKKGKYATLYSTEKGIELKVKRVGGTLHMDLEPATAADTEKLKTIAGGQFSWARHPVILKADGHYVACSINTMPHGTQTIKDNNFDGQFCLHMVSSKTHGTNKVDADHQATIQKAYNWAHNK